MKEVLSAETKRKLAELSALEAAGVAKLALYGEALCRLNGIIFTDDTEPESESESETPWLPIKTAPKYGSMLVSVPPDDEVFKAFRVGSGRWLASDPRGGGYYYLHTEPSHWMPLPPLPEENIQYRRLDKTDDTVRGAI